MFAFAYGVVLGALVRLYPYVWDWQCVRAAREFEFSYFARRNFRL